MKFISLGRNSHEPPHTRDACFYVVGGEALCFKGSSGGHFEITDVNTLKTARAFAVATRECARDLAVATSRGLLVEAYDELIDLMSGKCKDSSDMEDKV